MPSISTSFGVTLLSSLTVGYAGSPDAFVQGRANIVTITQTVTSTLTSCAAPTTKPGSSAITATAPTAASTSVTQQDSFWNVPSVGLFSNKAVYTFNGNSLPNGLSASQYTVEDGGPFDHTFTPANVQVVSGFLNLLVPGGQDTDQDGGLQCAEIVTTQSNILHASVRTKAIFSGVPGTCHGAFFYKSDSQETDIEYLTDPNSLANDGPDKPIPIWYSNQAVRMGVEATQNSTNPPASDATTAVHEYRIDWTSTFTAFYFDGVLQSVFTTNVPTKAGSWVWNNWANGDPNWSAGPPEEDNTFRIQSIEMYYNTTSN